MIFKRCSKVLGYNFSLAGVFGREKGPFARGGAESEGLTGSISQEPIRNGMVWNMVCNPDAPSGFVPSCSQDEIFERVGYFLNAVLPTAEEAGVILAAHPDDPPMDRVSSTPRLVRILANHGFDGVLIPDHTPTISGPGGWYSGMAYAMGYMQRCLQEVRS
jgi:hypothetical protein